MIQAFADDRRGRTTMADGPQAIEVPGSWVGADELPLHFANAFVAVIGPNAIFVSFGSVVPPAVMGETEEEREAYLRSIPYVAVKPIVRLALTPKGLDELIATLEGTRKNYAELRKAIEDEGEQ
jgi:hypothetical protein